MTISGETIDYGPCAFMEAYDPATVFSSIDAHGRYAYGNQPLIAQWNLARFAETLLPLIDSEDAQRAVEPATQIVNAFTARFEAHWLAGARAKLGLAMEEDGDLQLAQDWLALLHERQVDYTLAWRRLSDAAVGSGEPLDALFGVAPPALQGWLERWRERGAREGVAAHARGEAMQRANPAYIPRNHRVEEALAAASEHGDFAPFDRLLAAIAQPFDERAELADYAQPAPAQVTACYKTFCGT
jgi:serine/tyrosine/threonine adenylyltransferase